MEFNRPPRIQKTITPYEVKIPFPTPLPQEPKINWLTLVLPILITGVIIGAMAMLMSSSSSYLMFLPLMLVGIIVSIVSFFQQKKEYKITVEERIKKYKEFLFEKENSLKTVKNEQLTILIEKNPSPKDCVEIAAKTPPDLRLGERRPEDDDFLKVRIGCGVQPSQIKIETPEETNRDTVLASLYDDVERIRKEYLTIEKGPILTSIPDIGCIGIVGEEEKTKTQARAMILSLVTHHWLSEVQLAVFCPRGKSDQWKWMQSLPHKPNFSSNLVIDLSQGEIKNQKILNLEHEIRRRLAYKESNTSSQVHKKFPSEKLPTLIIFLDHISDIYKFAAFSLILEKSRDIGIYAIFLSDNIKQIPGECGAIIECKEHYIDYKETGINRIPVMNIMQDEAPIHFGEKMGEYLRKINWIVPEKITEPPDQLSLIEMFGTKIDDLPLEKWWDEDSPWGFLKAPIGKFSPTADLIFDLSENGHGPHGIIGGTTGSGKSETLRTLILSLALTHNPYDLNFALIDFKGGAAFQGLEKLPHVVGVITDIENNVDYASRVIHSLSGEVKSRKQVLNKALEKISLFRAHVDDYRAVPVRRPLPHLVIIFDEFAEFKELYPAESHQLVSIARVGRSLGIHLILCAQSPAAVVEDQIRQNSKFRICLPVSSAEDSNGFIGIPDAANIPVGQAYFLVKKPQKLRVAYTGDYQLESYLPDDAIVKTNVDGKREVIYPIKDRQILPKAKTESMILIEKIIKVADTLGIFELPKVWQTPLPEKIYLSDLLLSNQIPLSWVNEKNQYVSTPKHGVGLIYGLMDDPVNQLQPVCSFGSKGSSKHLLVYGSSGSGKSTLLRTLIMGIAMQRTPAEANIYCLDFGGQQSLRIFQDDSEKKNLDLPHLPRVGGVISSGEKERINRLFGALTSIIMERERKFQGKAGNLDEYNKKVGEKEKLADIFVFVDGLSKQITDQFEGFTEALEDILKKGGAAGIHLVITANNVDDVPEKIKINITGLGDVVILKPAGIAHIQSTFGNPAPDSFMKKAVAGQQPKAGQGVCNKNPVLEMQVALPIQSEKEREFERLQELITRMNQAWKGERPVDIDVLPIYITDKELKAGKYSDQNRSLYYKNSLGVHLGIEQKSLKSYGFSIENDGPIFQIWSDTSRLGKTSILQSWILNLADEFLPNEIKFLIIDFHQHSMIHFSTIPHLFNYVNTPEELGDALDQLSQEIKTRREQINEGWKLQGKLFDKTSLIKQSGYIVIIVDDYVEMIKDLKDEQIEYLFNCFNDGKDLGIRMIFTEDLAHYTSDDLLKMSSKYGCGILLGGVDGLERFNDAMSPGIKPSLPVPPGRGYLVKQRRALFFQAATFYGQDEDAITVLEERISKLT